MFYQYDNDEHETKAKDVLAGLGEFVVSFERVCSGMRGCIHSIFRREGLTNQMLCQVTINKLAADGLKTMLGALFVELRDQDEEDKGEVSKLLRDIGKLGETRNNLLHAEWFLNYDYEESSEEFVALALKSNMTQSAGALHIKIPVSRSILNSHIEEATKLQVKLRRLDICLAQKGFKVSKFLSEPL